MATLENIRSKGPLLIVVIGLALAAFIIGDFLNSAGTFFGSNRENVGEIAGENIHIVDFQNAVEQMSDWYEIESGQRDLNEEIISQIRASVWETMVTDRLLQLEARKIGLAVSSDELVDRTIGNNPHPIILQTQFFFDETGRFNRGRMIEIWAFDEEPFNAEMAREIQKMKNHRLFVENRVKMEILREKYNVLISNAVTANNIDARSNFDARQRLVDFTYVAQPYFMIPDSVVSVSSREIRDRYNRDKELFRQEASRSINYVVFDVRPMEDDYAQAQEWMDRASAEFQTTDDIVGFINSNNNSDVVYDGRNLSELTVPILLREFAFSGREGDFFGPVFLNDTHTMARIMQTGILTSDSVKLSRIVLFPGQEELADSLFNILQRNRNADFGAMAREFSQDQQTAMSDGELGWLVEGMRNVDRELMDAFDKNTGDVYRFSNAQGVIQILKVTEKTAPRPKVRLAILERRVMPSSRSQAHIFNTAKQFAASARNVEGFQTLAEAENLSVRPANNLDENADRASILPQSRQIVRWAFNANLGTVSDVFDIGNQFVVAVVTEVNKKGFAPLEKVTPQILAELTREKKAEYMIKDISNRLAANNSLEGLAHALNVDVREAENVSFASQTFGRSGVEPFVIGSALNVPMNQISKPIRGNSGVYVVRPTNEIIGMEEFNAVMEIMQLNSRNRHSLPFMIFDDIRRNANVVDSRSVFY
jgi:peptidyl-prolyl cis-trans isomerase D